MIRDTSHDRKLSLNPSAATFLTPPPLPSFLVPFGRPELDSQPAAIASHAPAPPAVAADANFIPFLRALDEAGWGMNYLGRYLGGLQEFERTGVLSAAETRGFDYFMQRLERKSAGRGRSSAKTARKRANREEEHEECAIDAIPPCAPPGAGGLGHESLVSDTLLQTIHRLLMQIHPDMSIERGAIVLAADLLKWTAFSYARSIDPALRLKHDLSCASDRSAIIQSLQMVVPANIFKYASKEVENHLEKLKSCATVDARTWGVCDTGLQVELGTIVSSCEGQRLQISYSVAVPISAVGEYVTAEILEVSGTASKTRGQYQHCITVADIKKGINDDEDLRELFEPFWTARKKVSVASTLSSHGAISNARKKLRGSTDTRHVFKVKSDRDESVTILDIGSETLKQSEVLSALLGTADADCIVVPASASAIAAACALAQCAELRTSDSWFHDGMQSLGLDDDCALFASVFKVVHVLGLTLLADILSMNLESPGDGHELERLSSCLSAEVPLARMLHKRFGLDDEASASALFSRLLNAPPAHLSYHDLELCDGMFLHAPQYCSLGLVAWTKRERARREMITNEGMRQNAEARASLTKADVHDLNQKLWDAVDAGDVAAAQCAFSMGACADLFLESADKDDPRSDDDEIARWQKHKAPLMLFSEYLSRRRFCGDSMNAYGSFPREIRDGLSTLMLATQKNDLCMMKWLLDVGCNVNTAQPKSYVHGDGFEFGGMTALAFASSIDSMNLLLSRGANALATYTPPQYESRMEERSILVGLLQIMSSDPQLRDTMAMALIRHGADVNDVGYPCYDDGQDAGSNYVFECPPACFWPSVVIRGDVDCAKELLQIYNADANWPCSFNLQELYGLGAPVLQMAVLKRNRRMIELLLDHGADVNCKEQVFVNFENFHERGIESAEDIFFLDKSKCLHYWGTSSIDEASEIDIPEGKKATALSVALANGCSEDIIEMLRQAGANDDMISARSHDPVVLDFLPAPPSPCVGSSSDDDELQECSPADDDAAAADGDVDC